MSHPPGPRIYLVAAVASNGIIGSNGRLPWHFPEELRHATVVTLGHPVIMGRHLGSR
jgi:dihydrofolate reductase